MRPLQQFAKSLDSRGFWLPLIFRSHWYDRLDKSQFRTAFRLSQTKAKSGEALTELRFRACALSASPAVDCRESGPPIELLLVCAAKDFDTLPFAIEQALANCVNSIYRVTVITPDKDKVAADSVCRPMRDDSGLQITVQCDSDWLSQEAIVNLKHSFGDRFGWIAQQLITTSFVLQSAADAVLVLNADTFLTRKQTFLKSNGNQILHRSSEYMPDYYRFLRALEKKLVTKATHITHHMLMQPAILRQIFESLGLSGIADLQDRVIKFAAITGQKAFCLEFEVYAQFAKELFPERMDEVKFANIGVPRPGNDREIRKLIEYHQKAGRFNSVSLHDYLS